MRPPPRLLPSSPLPFLPQLLLSLLLLLLLLPLQPTTAYTPLSDHTLAHLPFPHDLLSLSSPASILTPILIPRVPGTPGSLTVLNHFLTFFRTQLPLWNITLQNSTAVTPLSSTALPFTNLIATRDPPNTPPGEVSRLALVAHYDSKSTPAGFIGATDSAAPCAMILAAAAALDAALTRKWAAAAAAADDELDLDTPRGLQIILLDGEEAFHTWTRSDSLYGARALASHWEATPNPPLSTYATPLHQISLFLLLDLLGAPGPTVPSYYLTTHWAYTLLASLEARLRSLHLFKSPAGAPFLPDTSLPSRGQRSVFGIEDDHIPFLEKGVEVLHLIPVPFPDCWHEEKGVKDDITALDEGVVGDWGVLVAGWVGGWLGLEGWFDLKDEAGESKGGREEERGERKRWGEGWGMKTEL